MFLAESSNDEMFLVGKFGVQKIEMENRCPCWWGGPQCLNHPNRFRKIQKANNCGQTGNKRWYETMTNELWSAWEWIYWFTLLDVPSLKYWITVGACALFTWGSMLPVGYIRYFPMWKIKMTKEHQIYNILATMSDFRIGRHVAYELPADSSAKENALLKATAEQDVARHWFLTVAPAVFAQHLRVVSAATLDRWPEVCQTSSFLRSISYCGRLGGWSFGKSSVNSTVNVTSGRGSARHDGKSRATSQGKKPGLAADGAKKKGRDWRDSKDIQRSWAWDGFWLSVNSRCLTGLLWPVPFLCWLIHRFSWPGSSWHRSSQVHSSLVCWWGHLAKGRGGNMNPHDQVYQSSKR